MDRAIRRSFLSRHKGALSLVLAALAIAVVWIFLKPTEAATFAVTTDRLVISRVEAGTFEDFVPIRGRVTPLNTIYLDAVEGGRVDKVHVEDGALVTPGQFLVELSNASLQFDAISREAEVVQQLNNFATLELELKRNRLDHSRRLLDIKYEITRLKRKMGRIAPLYKIRSRSKEPVRSEPG